MINYTLTPLDELRRVVNFFNHWNENWNDQWDTNELLAICRFAMSEEGGNINEDPRAWNRATLAKALGCPMCGTCESFYVASPCAQRQQDSAEVSQ